MIPSLDLLRAGGKRAMAQALAAIETRAGTPELATLLDEANREAKALVLGLTGPPGVGKSTLTNALVRAWRDKGETVGVIAIDPSSRKTGGALLGDRARITTDPDDRGVFIRSMAARDRLGGLSDQTVAAMVLMRATFDHVLIESVGIGQSEADIGMAADTVILCIQPASGDALQFMKAGVMELPDIMAITKADLGEPARRAKADVEGALTLVVPEGEWRVPVTLISSTEGTGMGDLINEVARHAAFLREGARLHQRRTDQEAQWVEEAVRARFGSEGWTRVAGKGTGTAPFARMQALLAQLEAQWRPAP